MQQEEAQEGGLPLLTVKPVELEKYFGPSSSGAERLETATNAQEMNQIIQNKVCVALELLEALWDRMGSATQLRNTVKQTLLLNIESSCQTLVETQLASEARLVQSINTFLADIALVSAQLGFNHHLVCIAHFPFSLQDRFRY